MDGTCEDTKMVLSGKRVSTYSEIANSEWELIELIGKGTYGEVYRGRNKKSNSIVAIKVTDFNRNKNEEMKTELAVLENFSSHENIVKFIGAQFVATMSGTEQLWIITEVYKFSCLFDHAFIR